MSSAILYFAIVAIWAGVLMPKWLRPSQPSRQRAGLEQQEFAEVTPDGLHASEADARPEGTRPGTAAPAAEARPARDERAGEESGTRRASILKARRRMLGTLAGLTCGALVIALVQLAAWWVVVPPGVLLAGFLLLLREASRVDAAQARQRAQAEALARSRAAEARMARSAAAGRLAAAEQAALAARGAPDAEAPGTGEQRAVSGAARPAAAAAPGALIIDISARVSDEPYDQYTDAAERAVGD